MHKFTVNEYQRMIRAGILTAEDAVELLEGWIVQKMPRNPPHDAVVARLINKVIGPRLPADWFCRGQSAAQTASSQPEPDVAVVRGTEFDFLSRHPGPGDIALVIEVCDSTLNRDCELKSVIYARTAIPVFWIVNLIDRQIEVFTEPTGPASNPAYQSPSVVGSDGVVPLAIAGRAIAEISVRDILPPDSLTPATL